MSFIVKQRKNGKIYHYEATNYWDKEKKQSRQKRRYLGVEDENGEVKTPRKEIIIKRNQEYGVTYLLNALAEECKLKKVLKEIYPESYQDLLNLVFFKISTSSPYYLYKDWSESVYLPSGHGMTSQDASRFMIGIGDDEDRQTRFFRKWISTHKDTGGLIFDITSISSHSKLNSWVEWGYNRDGELLPQLNLGAIVAEDLGLPLAYRFCSGSIPDVITLKNTVIFSQDIGLKRVDFVLDRGFFSKKNIEEMDAENIGFTIPISFSTTEAKKFLQEVKDTIELPENALSHNKTLIHHQSKRIRIGNKEYDAHMFLNTARKQDSLSLFYERLFQVERDLEEIGEEEKIEKYFEEYNKSYKDFFIISDGEIKRNNETIKEHCLGMGKMILITSKENQDPSRLLDIYVQKDVVEKCFDNMKNELDENRLRVSTRESFSGRLFVTFLSLILRMYLSTKSNKSGLSRDFAVPEIISKLKLIRKVQTQNGFFISEISKKQRDIFQKLGVEVPS